MSKGSICGGVVFSRILITGDEALNELTVSPAPASEYVWEMVDLFQAGSRLLNLKQTQ